MRSALKIIFVAAFAFHSLAAQTGPLADSILTALKTRPNDTVRAKLYCDLAWEYRHNDPKKAMRSAEDGYALSAQLHYVSGMARALRLEGIFSRNTGDNASAVIFLNEAIHIADSIHDDKLLGDSYQSLGETYRLTSDNSEAMKNYQLALAIFQQRNDQKNIALAKNNMGIIYYNQDNMQKALELYTEALNIRRSINDKSSISISLNNIANVYARQDKFDTALQYQSEALAINRELHDLKSLAISYQNVGEIHSLKNESAEALSCFDSAMFYFSAVQDSLNIACDYVKMGAEHVKMKDYTKAAPLLANGLNMATRMRLKQIRLDALDGLRTMYSAQGNFQKAYACISQMYALRDSIVNEANSKSLNEMETRFDTKQKQAEIEVLSQKNRVATLEVQQGEEQLRRNQIIMYASIAGGILVIILLFVLLNRYEVKKKANHQLAQKNQLIEAKNKNITESIRYARRIQKSLLPTEKYIDRQLKELKEKNH